MIRRRSVGRRAAIVLTLAGLAIPFTLRAQQSASWYVIRMAGKPAGWMHERRTRSDSGVSVATNMHLALNRLGSSVVIEMGTTSFETTGGSLRRADGTMRLSDQTTETHAAIELDSVRIRAHAGERDFERSVPLTKPAIGPAAIERLTADRLHQPGDSVVYGTFDVTASVPSVVTRVLIATDTIAIQGLRLEARRLAERSTASPLEVTYWIDAHGATLRTAYDSPFGRTESDVVDSVTALAAAGGAELSEDQYASTLVRTGVRLPQARNLETLTLVLTARDTSLRWPVFDAPNQHVLLRDRSSIALEIERTDPPAGEHKFPVAPTLAIRDYLTPNAYVQSDDPSLHALAQRIVGRETDAWRASLLLEHWVADSMHFDLGVAFAPSSEVFERRRGTCVAYATLLATLTRTLGIPSRVAFGYGYVNGMFGGHAWTEVLIGDTWVGIDGALVPARSADAARFAFEHGSLAGGPAELTSSAGGLLYGRIDARIRSYEVGGERMVTLDSTKPGYTVQDNVYRNATVGIELRKPQDGRFIELDETWPALTIAAIVDDRGDTARVRSVSRDPWVQADDQARKQASLPSAPVISTRADGRPGLTSAVAGHAVLAIPNRGETLVVDVVGPAAAELLRIVASGLRVD